jgi:hypothetical protein
VKLLFIHVPKTGGTSVEHAFPGSRRGHKTLTQLRESLGLSTLRSMYIATFVRNPWNRLWSWYLQENHNTKWSFEEYVMTQAKTETYVDGFRPTKILVARQEEWIEDEHISPRFIGRFEHYEQDFKRLCGSIGVRPFSPPHLKYRAKTPVNRHYLWTPEMIEHMDEIFDPFAERFGYSPP